MPSAIAGEILILSIVVFSAGTAAITWTLETERWNGKLPEGTWDNCTLADSERMPECKGYRYEEKPNGLYRCRTLTQNGLDSKGSVCEIVATAKDPKGNWH